jgi:uncharacterized protein (UPF0335 family)
MTPEQIDKLLRAVVASLERWEDEAAELTADCPELVHLAASIKQARFNLEAMLKREGL